MTTMRNQSRRNEGHNAIKLAVRHRAMDVYIRVIERRSTTQEATEQGHWLMFQLALQVAQRIGVDNLSVLKHIHF